MAVNAFRRDFTPKLAVKCSVFSVCFIILGFHRYYRMSLLARAAFRNKGIKRWVKTNTDNNFWVNSTLQITVIEKIIFRKLQDTVFVRHVGVPLWSTNRATIKVSTQEIRQPMKSTLLVSLHSYVDDISRHYNT